MRLLFTVVIAAVMLCGCTLIYNGSVITNDSLKAVEVSKILEEEYAREGFQNITLAVGSCSPKGAFYWAMWAGPVEVPHYAWGVDIIHFVEGGNLGIRIVPPPRHNKASRAVGEQVSSLLTNRFPDFRFQLVGRLEPDSR